MLAAYGMGLLPQYPVASGLLSGNYCRNATMPAGARLKLHGGRRYAVHQ